jgi:arginyl-tRNA synthetase
MSEVKLNKPNWLVEKQIKKILADAGGGLGIDLSLDEVHLEHPVEGEHGDYASNLAMAKFKQVEGFKSPFDLAQKIAKQIDSEKSKLIFSVEAKQPGFINFFLDKNFLASQAQKFLDLEKFKQALVEVGHDKTMVIDYSSPNIAKPFGIGHLRSTNIGQAIYNLYDVLGWQAIGDNHLGDWGTQFGKLIVAIKKWWDKDLRDLTIADLEKLYVKFHQQAKNESELEDQAREWFKKLEEKDKEAKKIWQVCVDISLGEFDRVYQMLGVDIDEAYGEAFYFFNNWMDKVLKDLEDKGLIKESQGAKVVEIEGYDTPAMIVKSDGATTYLTRDLATLKFRKQQWDPDLVVYEVGGEQKFHFKQVFQLSEKLGYIDQDKLVHVAHGLIGSGQGGKLSTRKGESIYLETVLNQAIEQAKKMISQSKIDKGLSDKGKKKISQAVGISAVKFNDLKQEPQKDVVFDWDQMLSLDGYSGPYLQYSLARAKSVLNKAEKGASEVGIGDYRLNSEELALLREFYQLPEILITSAENFGPHHLCQYLFGLAQKFNLFYQKHRILDPESEQEKKLRLFLTQVTANILEIGLNVLGIEVLERM